MVKYMIKEISCPNCGGNLKVVCNYFGSMLNDEQFDAIKSGDYYCDYCHGNRGHSGFRYFWEKEISTLEEIK